MFGIQGTALGFKRLSVCATACAIATVGASAMGVSAASAATASSPMVSETFVSSHSTLVLTVADSPASRATLRDESAQLEKAGYHAANITPQVIVGGGGGAPQQLVENKNYSFSDSDGTFTIRYNSAYSNTNWGYKISSALAAIATSDVSESGMLYQVNYGPYQRNSPHVEGATYTFHGTMTPCSNLTVQSYYDTLNFSVPDGNAELEVYGAVECVS